MRAEHLYLHVPFCARRCVYCDFSIAVRSTIPVREYIESVERELLLRYADVETSLATLYVGGGTPSKLGSGIESLIDAIRSRVAVRDDAEVTIEANPEDVNAANVRAWRRAGVNRLSLGVQSFDNRVLAWMHRTHDAETARVAVATARDEGIDNLSIDLIFATPMSISRDWHRDLDSALALDVPHLSVYGLTIEPRTPLGRWTARHEVMEAPEEHFEAEFLLAHDRIESAGLEHYEVSNYGRPGRQSRHNSSYWQRMPYAGLGPSAHEFDGAVRRWNVAPYAAWRSMLIESIDPMEGSETLTEQQRIAEDIYLGLRTTIGVVVSDSEMTVVRRWVDAGWATCDERRTVRLTALGWLRLDALAGDLTHVRSRY